MIKALKVVMIIFGVILILKGLQDFIAPRLMVEMLGLEEPPPRSESNKGSTRCWPDYGRCLDHHRYA